MIEDNLVLLTSAVVAFTSLLQGFLSNIHFFLFNKRTSFCWSLNYFGNFGHLYIHLAQTKMTEDNLRNLTFNRETFSYCTRRVNFKPPFYHIEQGNFLLLKFELFWWQIFEERTRSGLNWYPSFLNASMTSSTAVFNVLTLTYLGRATVNKYKCLTMLQTKNIKHQ